MNDYSLIIIFIAGTSLLALFAFFLIAIVIVQKSKQNKYKTRLLEARIHEKDLTLNKISHEIHDNFGQVLNLVQLNLYTIKEFAKNDAEKLLIQTTNELVRSVSNDLHNISHSLNGDYIKRTGLNEVLSKELKQISHSKNIACTIDINDEVASLEPDKEVIIYRIAQEAIHNTIKHSKATELKIELHNTVAAFSLAVIDNGIGFEKKKDHPAGGIGLGNMAQRAKLIGGNLEVESAIGKGTSITLFISKQQK